MRVFKDKQGRQWQVVIDVASMKRVRDLLKINLYKLVEDGLQPLADLVGNPILLVDVLYALCKEQADRDKVSDVDYGRAMGGDALEAGAVAFVEELSDFFPARTREAIRAVREKSQAVADLLHAELSKGLAETEPAKVAADLLTRSKRSAGSSPESAALTRAP